MLSVYPAIFLRRKWLFCVNKAAIEQNINFFQVLQNASVDLLNIPPKTAVTSKKAYDFPIIRLPDTLLILLLYLSIHLFLYRFG